MLPRIGFLLWFIAAGHFAFASVLVQGSYEALQPCEAYLSKNKRTNPDNIYLSSGVVYSLIEINRLTQPDWFRVNIKKTSNPLRWVHRSCGTAQYDLPNHPKCNPLPGNADAHVLALSWQPGFCETYGYEVGKQECLHLSANSFAQDHIVLHGLWPNQHSCGHQYAFCGVSSKPHHCDYQALSLSLSVSKNLNQYMPGYAYGSCLERHEWYKHGTCQLDSEDGYFLKAVTLAKEINDTPFALMLKQYSGGNVALSLLEEAIEASFGKGSNQKIYLGCTQGELVDIYLNLPAELHDGASLKQLLQAVKGDYSHHGCPNVVRISNFTAPFQIPGV